MQLQEIDFGNSIPVQAYGPGYFRVADEVHEGPLLLVAGQVLTWQGAEDHAALTQLAGEVDVILFGTGAEMDHIPEDLDKALVEVGLAAEPMASAQACRSYNLLLSEGRRVALAALPV